MITFHNYPGFDNFDCAILCICYCQNTFTCISLRIFASICIKDISLSFSFLVISLPGFGIRVTLAF